MDGDVCPLPELVEVAKNVTALAFMLDEAHSGFVYGERGRGVAEHFGLENEVDIHVGTFSKALGGQGGYVAGSRTLYNYLKGFARSRVFSCALLARGRRGGSAVARRSSQREPQLRDAAVGNVRHVRNQLEAAGVDVGDSTSQIMPIMVRNDRRVFEVCHKLLQRRRLSAARDLSRRGKAPFAIPCFHLGGAHREAQLDEGAAILVRVLREERILV